VSDSDDGVGVDDRRATSSETETEQRTRTKSTTHQHREGTGDEARGAKWAEGGEATVKKKKQLRNRDKVSRIITITMDEVEAE